MEPSSLIFVAILGVWAAYLVPHWLRKRDDLAQSRTLDRFSQRLRVLQRRPRPVRTSVHRSGAPVLSSPRLVVDTDGEFLYIPGDRVPATKAEPMNPPEPVTQAEPSVAKPEPSVAKPEPVAEPAATPAAPSVPVSQSPAQPARSNDLEHARAGARVAARRRAAGMILLLAATAGSWIATTALSITTWAALPATVLLVVHALASRVAGLRSRATLTLLAAQLYAAELALSRPRQAVAEQAAEKVAGTAVPLTPTPDRVARRAAAVGAQTWEPVPVPPPTYTLKPAVHRPEPAPLPADAPAAQPAAASAASAAAVSRGALPRRAADIERILALESDVDELFDQPKVVNG